MLYGKKNYQLYGLTIHIQLRGIANFQVSILFSIQNSYQSISDELMPLR